MYWPFKTTVKFATDDAQEIRLEYLVSAKSSIEAKSELERRLLGQEVFGYIVEKVVAATKPLEFQAVFAGVASQDQEGTFI